MLMKKLGSLSAAALALTLVLVRSPLALASEPLNNYAPWYNPPIGAFHGDASIYTTTTNAGWGTPEDMPANDVDYLVLSCGGLYGDGAVSYVEIFYTYSKGDVDMKVYTTDGALMGISQGVTNYEYLDVSAYKTGSVVLKVYGYLGAANAGGYTVSMGCK